MNPTQTEEYNNKLRIFKAKTGSEPRATERTEAFLATKQNRKARWENLYQ